MNPQDAVALRSNEEGLEVEVLTGETFTLSAKPDDQVKLLEVINEMEHRLRIEYTHLQNCRHVYQQHGYRGLRRYLDGVRVP